MFNHLRHARDLVTPAPQIWIIPLIGKSSGDSESSLFRRGSAQREWKASFDEICSSGAHLWETQTGSDQAKWRRNHQFIERYARLPWARRLRDNSFRFLYVNTKKWTQRFSKRNIIVVTRGAKLRVFYWRWTVSNLLLRGETNTRKSRLPLAGTTVVSTTTCGLTLLW